MTFHLQCYNHSFWITSPSPKNIIQTEQLHFEMLVEDKVFTDHLRREMGPKKRLKKVKFGPKSLRNSKWFSNTRVFVLDSFPKPRSTTMWELHPSMRPDLQIPDRLEKDNPHVKLKCLKIIKHVSWHISKLVSVGRMEKHMSERDWECVLNIWGLF